MKLRRFILPFALSLLSLAIYSQGVKLQGNNYYIDNRTSYSVFESIRPVFHEKLSLAFDLAPQDLEGDFAKGYILRIKNEEQGITFNILYDGQGGSAFFNLNHEGKDVLIAAKVDKDKLYERHWIHFLLVFNLKRDSVMLQINGESFYADSIGLKPDWRPLIHFGRSEHVIDIPTFALRNLVVGDGKKDYVFPLNESKGETVHDISERAIGHVSNPDWLINDAYFWKFETSFFSKSVAGSIFDSHKQKIYYINKDSIIIYDVHSGKSASHLYVNKCPMKFRLGTSFLDNEKNYLYMYEVVPAISSVVTIARLNLDNYTWEEVSSDVLEMQLHHHCNFLDEANRRYILFGGFGDAHYNKTFYSYGLDTNQWSTLSFKGDKITPRYFSSMGYNKSENALYLFGGMGNESGNQSVGRVYYYDLYRIDLNRNVIKKLWEIKWNNENVVPVRGMLVAEDGYFYTLCYPEHFSKSLLKLYRFSLKNGSFEILGDSIPIISEKITTNANLYYSKNANELYSVVQEFENDDIASSVKIYSLLFPPIPQRDLMVYHAEERNVVLLVMIGIAVSLLLLVAVAAYYTLRKKKRLAKQPEQGVDEDDNSAMDMRSLERRANAIYLFGDLLLVDRKGKDISYMLSTKLKQAFLVILQNSTEQGISSQDFSESMWPGKSEEKVKNSRGVTINILRKVLSELDGIKLVYEKGYFKILFDEACYCDYVYCSAILAKKEVDESVDELAAIISRGKFLGLVNDPLFDSFKSQVEHKLEPVLSLEMEKSYMAGKYKRTTYLCKGMFDIDPLSEEALYYTINALLKLKMANEAKKKYVLFVSEYENTMMESYSKSFADCSDKASFVKSDHFMKWNLREADGFPKGH